MKYNKLKANAVNEMQFNAGLLLNSFDPANPVVTDEAIISVTTGGITAEAVPSLTDLLTDADNAPKGAKEGVGLEGWECKLSCTLLGITPETIRLALGLADIGLDGKITLSNEVKDSHFQNIWWVGERTDGTMIAIELVNALSDGGFSLQTTDKGKGQLAVSFKGHASVQNIDEVPMNIYVGQA